jgi:hypothetical protein
MLMTKIDNSADKRRVIRVRKNMMCNVSSSSVRNYVPYGFKPIEGPEDSAKREGRVKGE